MVGAFAIGFGLPDSVKWTKNPARIDFPAVEPLTTVADGSMRFIDKKTLESIRTSCNRAWNRESMRGGEKQMILLFAGGYLVSEFESRPGTNLGLLRSYTARIDYQP